MDDYENTKKDRYHGSPFFFGKDSHDLGSFSLELAMNGLQGEMTTTSELSHKLSEYIKLTDEKFEAIQNAIKILALGLNYRRYSRFRLYTPIVQRTLDGKYHYTRTYCYPSIEPCTDDVNFCMDFVIESSIKLQEFDYKIKA